MQKFIPKFFVSLFIACFFSTNAFAGVGCQGPVNRIVGDQNTLIQIDWGWGNIKMCRLGSNMNVGGYTFTPENCRYLHMTALTAMGIGSDILIYFPEASSCAEALINGQVATSRWSFVHIIAP
jgi:hypothetical protein